MLRIAERVCLGTINGKAIERVTVTSSLSGFAVSLVTLGATLTSVKVADRRGCPSEITLGHDSVEAYIRSSAYLGVTIGRVANRIAGGEFSLDGERYELAKNDRGLNCLHGGTKGFDRAVWDLQKLDISCEEIAVPFAYVSPHMEQGFPGTVSVKVIYTIRDNRVRIDYRATTDRPTLLNLTNHAYWNLEGVDGTDGKSCMDHMLHIQADAYLPVDPTLVPTGEIASVSGRPIDFRRTALIRDAVTGFGDIDHCFVLNGTGLRPVAELYAPQSGRCMTLETDQAGLQCYTGNFLEGVPYRTGIAGKHQALCLETQAFPDAVHKPSFPSIVLRPGEEYCRTTICSFKSR